MSALYPELPFTSFPDSVQSFVTMLNMAVTDADYVRGYQDAMEQGDSALAQTYYNQIVNANQKFVDATKMNTLMQTCIALQRFYDSDIGPYIETQHTSWENRINQFNYVGVYSATQQYQPNNFVLYNSNGSNRVYICVVAPPVGTLPNNTNYWRELSIQGIQGESGDGVSFRYAWDSSQPYSIQDVVTYSEAVWIATQANTNQPPAEGSAYWSLLFTSGQVVYPFQSAEPSSDVQTGYLWFQIIG